jgi:hypothetical protein
VFWVYFWQMDFVIYIWTTKRQVIFVLTLVLNVEAFFRIDQKIYIIYVLSKVGKITYTITCYIRRELKNICQLSRYCHWWYLNRLLMLILQFDNFMHYLFTLLFFLCFSCLFWAKGLFYTNNFKNVSNECFIF